MRCLSYIMCLGFAAVLMSPVNLEAQVLTQDTAGDESASKNCLHDQEALWQEDIQPLFSHKNDPELIIFRHYLAEASQTSKDQAGGLLEQHLVYVIEGQVFLARRSNQESWRVMPTDSMPFDDFVAHHWPALIDDQVKPFRLKNSPSDSPEQSELSEGDSMQGILGSRLKISYVLFHKNRCVNKEFYNRDIDSGLAEINGAFVFNQTLKLVALHKLMDSLFL